MARHRRSRPAGQKSGGAVDIGARPITRWTLSRMWVVAGSRPGRATEAAAAVRRAALHPAPAASVAALPLTTGDVDVDRVVLALESLLGPCPVQLLTPDEWAQRLEAASLRRDWTDQPLAELDAGRSLLDACARCGVSQDACDAARRLLLDAPERARKALGILAHGSDMVLHMPYGIVGATRVGKPRRARGF